MGIGRVGPPFFYDACVFLSKDSRDSFLLGMVYSDATVTNALLVVRTVDDVLRAAIELHDLSVLDDVNTSAGGGCPVSLGRGIGEIRYSGLNDIYPPYE